MTKTLATYVFAGTITSSPGPIPSASSASHRAAVPELRPTQSLVPM